MIPWKTTFLCEQELFHFHVSESECIGWLLFSKIDGHGHVENSISLTTSMLPARCYPLAQTAYTDIYPVSTLVLPNANHTKAKPPQHPPPKTTKSGRGSEYKHPNLFESVLFTVG